MKHSKLGLGLLVALAAMATMAFAASSVSATIVTPATGTEAERTVTVTSTDSKFTADNAFAGNSLACNTSATDITVPAEGAQSFNQNQTEVGTQSTGPGAVAVQMTQPTFEECFVRNKLQEPVGTVVVTPQDPLNVEDWSGAFYAVERPGVDPVVLAISVPQKALDVEINAGGFECTLLIASADQQQVVMGDFTKVDETSVLRVDGQVHFDIKSEGAAGDCEELGLMPATSPAQFEGNYKDPTGTLQVE